MISLRASRPAAVPMALIPLLMSKLYSTNCRSCQVGNLQQIRGSRTWPRVEHIRRGAPAHFAGGHARTIRCSVSRSRCRGPPRSHPGGGRPPTHRACQQRARDELRSHSVPLHVPRAAAEHEGRIPARPVAAGELRGQSGDVWSGPTTSGPGVVGGLDLPGAWRGCDCAPSPWTPRQRDISRGLAQRAGTGSPSTGSRRAPTADPDHPVVLRGTRRRCGDRVAGWETARTGT